MSAAPIPSSAAPSPSPRKVLLVGWEAADWKVILPLLDAGKMPYRTRSAAKLATAPA